mgnify:FL=1
MKRFNGLSYEFYGIIFIAILITILTWVANNMDILYQWLGATDDQGGTEFKLVLTIASLYFVGLFLVGTLVYKRVKHGQKG